MRATPLFLMIAVIGAPATAQTAATPATGSFGAGDYARGGESDVNNWPLDGGARPASVRQQAAAYEQALDYGRCAARVAPKIAASVLEADAGTADERNELNHLFAAGRPCLAYGANPPASFVRGGLAEALYARASAPEGAAAAERYNAFKAAEKARGRPQGIDQAADDFSSCIVARAPDQVRAVLRSKSGSKAERTAFDAMTGGSEACSGKPSAPTPPLRAALAEAALRWNSFGRGG